MTFKQYLIKTMPLASDRPPPKEPLPKAVIVKSSPK